MRFCDQGVVVQIALQPQMSDVGTVASAPMPEPFINWSAYPNAFPRPLAGQAQKVSFAAGDTIAEGDPADRFYVIAQGEVAITRRGPEGEAMKLATLGRGQFFGEVGILADTRRTATVRAVGDVELLGLSWQEFQETLERSDRADRDFSQIAKERIAFAP